MSLPVPPRTATWLLTQLIPHPELEPLLGDLHEEFVLVAATAPAHRARSWYIGQIARSVPPLVGSLVRRSDWRWTLGGALLGYVTSMLLGTISLVAVVQLLSLDGTPAFGASVLVELPASVVGGYVAAMVRATATPLLMLLSLITVLVLMIAAPDSAPLWYQLVFLIFGPLAAIVGGSICRRTRSCSHA